MEEYIVEFYCKEDGEEPARIFIENLEAKMIAKILRVLYFFSVGKKIVLTNGFIKKTQKTPKREIEIARMYKADYERRCTK